MEEQIQDKKDEILNYLLGSEKSINNFRKDMINFILENIKI